MYEHSWCHVAGEYTLYVTNHKTILTDTQKRELIDYCINSKDVEECIFEGPNYRDTTIWRKGDVYEHKRSRLWNDLSCGGRTL